MIVRQRPQSSAQSSPIRAPLIAAVVVGDVVLDEERDRVAHVLLVQLDDLELRQQRARRAAPCRLCASSRRSSGISWHMRNELTNTSTWRPCASSKKSSRSLRVHRVEADLRVVAEASSGAVCASPEPFFVVTKSRSLYSRWSAGGQAGRAQSNRDAAEQPERHVVARRGCEDASALLDDVGENLRRARQCAPLRRCRRSPRPGSRRSRASSACRRRARRSSRRPVYARRSRTVTVKPGRRVLQASRRARARGASSPCRSAACRSPSPRTARSCPSRSSTGRCRPRRRRASRSPRSCRSIGASSG